MLKKSIFMIAVLIGSGLSAFAGVTISSPANYANVPASMNVIASATPTSSAFRVSYMELQLDNVIKFSAASASFNTYIPVAAGTHNLVVKAWDTSGAQMITSRTVTNGSTTTVSATNATWNEVEQMSGWKSCDACAGNATGTGPSAAYWMKQGVGSPSLSGNSTQYFLGGTTPYANVLYVKNLLTDATKIRTLHHFVYDTYFYYTNAHAAQALEFDITQYIDSKRYIYGTQCNVRAGGVWDVWDNVNNHWIHTSAPCPAPPTYKWNHLTIEAERTADNMLHYISITLNGTKYYINKYYPPSANTNWLGVGVNFQMDGNYQQEDYTVYLDRLSLKTW